MTVFLKRRFPHVKELQQQYREGVGPLLVEGRGDSSTMGEAFDWAVRFLVCAAPGLDLALRGIARRHPRLAIAVVEMAQQLDGGYANGWSGLCDDGTFDGPAEGCAADEEVVLRACWALALLTQVYRTGVILPGSPLSRVDLARVSAADLLALMPSTAYHELRELRNLARSTMLPPLADRHGRWAVGPRFAGSELMNADADLIAGGLLIELKTALGGKRADGTRRASLEASTLHQLLGYVLLDFGDEYGLREVGLYSARYGHFATWRLGELLDGLAGRSVDLAAERQAFHALLAGDGS